MGTDRKHQNEGLRRPSGWDLPHPTLRRFSTEEEVFSDDLPQHII